MKLIRSIALCLLGSYLSGCSASKYPCSDAATVEMYSISFGTIREFALHPEDVIRMGDTVIVRDREWIYDFCEHLERQHEQHVTYPGADPRIVCVLLNNEHKVIDTVSFGIGYVATGSLSYDVYVPLLSLVAQKLPSNHRTDAYREIQILESEQEENSR